MNIPTPYRIPLFNEFSKILNKNGFSLKVVFGAWGYERRKWQIDPDTFKFNYEVLPSRQFYIGRSESVSMTYNGVFDVLRRERPVVTIIVGYSLGTMKLWLRNLFIRTPYVIWSGAIRDPESVYARLRRIQRRLLVRHAVGYIAYGSLAKQYLISLGAPDAQVSVAINTVDTAYFAREADAARALKRKSNVLLCIGDLTARKRPDLLIHAARSLARSRRDFSLVFVGDGPERARLRELARRHCVGDLVRFEGYKQKSEISAYLAQAACFLFPTGFDVWGLVLVEAMAAGVPCLASANAGATRDLIKDGSTGFVIDFENPDRVAERIDWLLGNESDAERIGRAGRELIEREVTIEESARGAADAVLRSLGRERLRDPVS